MSPIRSGLLAVWGSAWLANRVGYDELVERVTGHDEPHRVVGLPGAEGEVPLLWALSAWRDRGARSLRTLLPVPGDPRGLPGPGAFSTAAMAAGEAVLGGGLGLVPVVTRHGSAVGSAAVRVRWQAFDDLPAVPASPPPTVPEAERDLTAALRDAARELSGVGVASWHAEVAEEVSRLRRTTAPALPAGHDPRAVRLLAQADRLAAVLTLAEADAPGGALTASAAQARTDALRPLRSAVRQARIAAYNA
jgi:hypothetical protein